MSFLAETSTEVTFSFNSEQKIAFFEQPTGVDLVNHEYMVEYVQKQHVISPKNELVALNVNDLLMNVNNVVDSCSLLVKPVMLSSVEGNEVYRRSLVYILGMAFRACYPNDFFTVEHNLDKGYFCEVDDYESLDAAMVKTVLDKMKELVAANLPITERKLPYKKVVEYFQKTNRPFSQELVTSNNDPVVLVDICEDYFDLHTRPLLYRTGLFIDFDLKPYKHGMLLIFPPDPYKLERPKRKLQLVETTDINSDEEEPLIEVYKESNKFGEMTGIRCVGELNNAIRHNNIKRFIALNHALHETKIGKIARTVAKNRENVKLVLIAGPSSSGKTTFAQKLGIQLEINGVKPVVLSVDDYYRPNKDDGYPVDANGKLDFEAVQALRIGLLNEHILKLFEGEEVDCPIFDFKLGAPSLKTKKLRMPPGSVLVMEGIHCLNDELTHRIETRNKFKIFVAPMTQLNLNELNYISNSTNRLLRRMCRDYTSRGASALDTLSRWSSVRRGEDKHIFPFMKQANVIMNTALDYELSVLKVYATPLLTSVTPSSEYYNHARELLSFLNHFSVLHDDFVPPDSLLREFIGGSFFDV